MTNEQVVKVSSDEAVVKETVVNEEVINVEEVTEKKAGYEKMKAEAISQYDAAIAECDALLAKAASAGVVADGVVGEPVVVVEEEVVA